MWNGKHEVSVEWLGVAAGGQIGICTCGQRTEPTMQRQEAADWGEMHLMASRVGALYRGPRKPSLKSMVDYYDEQAANMTYSRKERGLWQQLADELRRTLPRLKRDPEDQNQLGLFGTDEGART